MRYMGETKRATVYFDPKIHRALRLKAAETDRSVSDLVNQAVRESLSDDAADLEAFGRIRDAFDPNGLLNPGKVLPEVEA